MKIKFILNDVDIFTHNECIICNSNNLSVLSRVKTNLPNKKNVDFLVTSICNNCTHVFRSTIPSEKWFISSFNYRYKTQKKYNFIPINDQTEKDRYHRYKELSNFLIEYSRSKSFDFDNVLDFGCGTGTGLQAWKDCAVPALGIEPDESRATYGKEIGHNIEIMTWGQYNNQIKQKSLVTCIHSLEHFYEPVKFLKHLNNLMCDRTLIYIEVPEVKDIVKDWNDALYLAHVSNFSEKSIITLLELCGYTFIERIFPYSDNQQNKNLCIVAVKGLLKQNKNVTDIKYNSDELKTLLKNRYSLKSSDKLKNINVFFVPEINDLSLCYKDTSEVKFTFQKNYESRSVKIKDDYISIH